jgi:hypothetical protein
MKNFKIPFFAIFLLASNYSVYTQQRETAAGIKAKHAAYFLCTNTMNEEPQKALEYCSAYLKKYPNDDARLVEFAGNFVKRYSVSNDKISSYLKSVSPDFFIGGSDSWAIYKPDLAKNIPFASEKDDNYKIEIAREYNSPAEEELLNKAEAVYKSPKEIKKDLYKNWIYLAQAQVDLPKGEPKWWMGFADTILQTEVVTSSAVIYYYNLSQNFRATKGRIKGNDFTFQRTDLKYDSSIKKLAKYTHAGKTFSNVYVADITMTWGQVCGGLCGYGWTRNKIVILNHKGDVLEMFLDADVNHQMWVS